MRHYCKDGHNGGFQKGRTKKCYSYQPFCSYHERGTLITNRRCDALKKVVTPANPGLQCFCKHLIFPGTGFHRYDEARGLLTFYEVILYRGVKIRDTSRQAYFLQMVAHPASIACLCPSLNRGLLIALSENLMETGEGLRFFQPCSEPPFSQGDAFVVQFSFLFLR